MTTPTTSDYAPAAATITDAAADAIVATFAYPAVADIMEIQRPYWAGQDLDLQVPSGYPVRALFAVLVASAIFGSINQLIDGLRGDAHLWQRCREAYASTEGSPLMPLELPDALELHAFRLALVADGARLDSLTHQLTPSAARHLRAVNRLVSQSVGGQPEAHDGRRRSAFGLPHSTIDQQRFAAVATVNVRTRAEEVCVMFGRATDQADNISAMASLECGTPFGPVVVALAGSSKWATHQMAGLVMALAVNFGELPLDRIAYVCWDGDLGLDEASDPGLALINRRDVALMASLPVADRETVTDAINDSLAFWVDACRAVDLKNDAVHDAIGAQELRLRLVYLSVFLHAVARNAVCWARAEAALLGP